MHDTALVTKISEKDVTVIPLIKDACLSCKEGCAKRGHPFEVCNSHNLPIKEGSIVKIIATKKNQAIQGLFSLFFPIMCAVAGYFATTPIANKLNLKVSDGLQAVFVLIGLGISTAIVFVVSRKKPNLGMPEIIEIV